MSRASDRHRLPSRLLRHHLPIGVLSVLVIALVYRLLPGDDNIWRLSMSTAYVGLALLGATLLVGPFNVITDRSNPVSIDLRRDIGIWAGIVGLTHFIVGLFVHFRGRMWLYFVPEKWQFLPVRIDPFGLANYTGLFASLVLIMLLVLSNDLAMRRYGRRRWKNLQRWNYINFGLILLHGVFYQILEKRDLPLVMVFTAMVAAVAAIQYLGFTRQRKSRAATRAQD